MPSIAYGASAYQRTTGNFPPLRCINMFLEQAKTSEGGVALVSRPGLATNYSPGSGPINGMFSKAGVLSGALFTVSDTTLYQSTTNRGTVNGTGVFRAAGSATELVFTRNGVPQSWNGTNLANITFPDTANVRSVCYIGNLFVFVRDATHKFYWSSPLDGRTVDALDFASAEREPDQLLDVAPLGDNLWLFGQSSVECWAHTGDADLPFTRIEQVAFDKGIHSTGCVVPADNSLFFVGSDRVVYRIGDVPQRISDNSIEQRIADSASAFMFTFTWNGHVFVVVRLASETLAYDCSTGEWCEFQTSAGNWIACDAMMSGGTAYFGHSSSGIVMTFSTSSWLDIAAALERRFSAALQLDEQAKIDNIRLWCNSGNGGNVQMRFSRDAGDSFSSYSSISLGTPNRTAPTWRRLGQFDFPGALFEFKCDSNVGFRVSAVKVNVPTGGRSRV